ncbi:MAG: hypothetical protein JXR19_04725 [Bacteroidia bacterium]
MKKILKLPLVIALGLLIGFTGCKEDVKNDPEPTTTNEVISGAITQDVTWTADKIYELAGKVVVEDGATLTINAGTIIKGRTGTGSLATALIVAKGGKLMANGTAGAPIIFTSILDNIEIGQKAGSNLTETDREKWGGLIILGKAPISAEDGDNAAQIEGIPADDAFGQYGGSDPADNSGTLTYVSIRHGGALIGEGNEINGLTLGGVGSGTTIDHIEVVANLDDGIECFGGTVNIDNALVAYQGDDAIDLDMNYSGTIDNFVVIHGGDTDEGLEIDGPEGSTHTTGLFTLTNGTIKSTDGAGSSADIKSKAQGTISNCVFTGYTTWIKIRANFDEGNSCAVKTDAYTNMTDGSPKLNITGNEILNGPGAMNDVANAYTQVSGCSSELDAAAQTAVDNAMSGNSLVATATKGADNSEFTGWTWADLKGML